MLEKVMQNVLKILLKCIYNGSPNPSKIAKCLKKGGLKIYPKIVAKKGCDYATARGGRRVGRDAPSNVLNISRRLVFVL